MYPPSSRVFGDKETAYAYYQSKKDELGKHYDPKIEVKHYSTKNGGETAIEGGGNEGAKRPCGVSIMCCTVE